MRIRFKSLSDFLMIADEFDWVCVEVEKRSFSGPVGYITVAAVNKYGVLAYYREQRPLNMVFDKRVKEITRAVEEMAGRVLNCGIEFLITREG